MPWGQESDLPALRTGWGFCELFTFESGMVVHTYNLT
jgi:hypothetical protein